MNSLNNDMLYYIGNFLEFNERIYFLSCIIRQYLLKLGLHILVSEIDKKLSKFSSLKRCPRRNISLRKNSMFELSY